MLLRAAPSCTIVVYPRAQGGGSDQRDAASCFAMRNARATGQPNPRSGLPPAVARPYLRRPMRAAEPAADDRLGPYRLLHELGRGGQAVVWLAEDTRIGRRVALKLLPALGPGSAALLRRFRREAEVTSRLDHPAICPVYDAEIEGGVPFIAMRFVDGETLARRIARTVAGGGGPVALRGEAWTVPDWPAIAAFFARAARALRLAHDRCRAPRREAAEPHGHARRRAGRARLRPRAPGRTRRLEPFAERRPLGHARLHEPRTAERPRAARPPQRRVRARLHAVRGVDRPPRVPGGDARGTVPRRAAAGQR